MRTLSGLLALLSLSAFSQIPPTHVDNFTGHPRLMVLSDIGNEPDDQMSLVRLLLYSQEIDIEGLVATTSTWQKTATHAETMHALVEAYGRVRPNLLKHAEGWPEAATLDARVSTGQTAYGMAATGAGKSTDGSKAVIRSTERDDPRPLWVSLWGGANTLAQALYDLRATRTPQEVDRIVARLRVYSISDQDDAGPWIRREFPNLFYIVSPSSPNSEDYSSATWTGISGDVYYRNAPGANSGVVTNEWLDKNIRSKGPLGKVYPKFMFIMEGDTPSYLSLIGNGLNAWGRPDWGGWGGRYFFRQPLSETHRIWTQGGDMFGRVNSRDTVAGVDGREVTSDQATIWRWREAYQNDFAARMDWTVAGYAAANHHPRLTVNGQGGGAPVFINAKVGDRIVLDASASSDPDRGQQLTYKWFVYAEAGLADGNLADIAIAGAATSKATATVNAACRPQWLPFRKTCPPNGVAHIILQVSDNGSPTLTSYRRVIVNVGQ